MLQEFGKGLCIVGAHDSSQTKLAERLVGKPEADAGLLFDIGAGLPQRLTVKGEQSLPPGCSALRCLTRHVLAVHGLSCEHNLLVCAGLKTVSPGPIRG